MSVEQALTYAFGHAVSSHDTDAHSAASGELAADVLEEIGLSHEAVRTFWTLAEHVAANYDYTGAEELMTRQIKNGEV